MVKLGAFFLCLLIIIKNGNCYPSLPSEPAMPSKVCTSLSAEMVSSKLDESKFDTSRIQSAINACASGEAVKLVVSGSNNAFISAPITLKSGVTLWVDKGVTLYASKNPKDYEKSSGSCGIVAASAAGCNPFISGSNLANSGVVGEGAIDGRGGDNLVGKSESWWQLAADAKKTSGMNHYNPRLIQIDSATNFVLHKISLHNTPQICLALASTGLTIWGIKIQSPTSAYPNLTWSNAINSDGIDFGGSSNVVIAHNSVDVGDDCLAIGGTKATKGVLIAHNHFYHGHGMSIGSTTSGGVSDMLVTDLTLDGTQNGIRIKSDISRGGLVEDIRYENICMRNVDSPFVFDPFYSTTATGSSIPDFQKIVLSGVHVTSSSKKTCVFKGYNAQYPLKVTLDNVQSDVTLTSTISNAEITEGPGLVKGVTLTGAKLSGTTKDVAAISCSFPSFGS